MKNKIYLCRECQITWGEVEDANKHYEKTGHKWKAVEEIENELDGGVKRPTEHKLFGFN